MIALPDTSTEVAIATTTLSSAASTITFSSIPNTYTDLRLVISNIRLESAGSQATIIRFNGDTATNYSQTDLYGFGASAGSSRTTSVSYIYLNEDAMSTTVPSFFAIDIFSYAGSANKTLLIASSEDKNGSGSVSRICGLWRSASAITSLTISQWSGINYTVGTTATLYGIL